MSLIVVFVLIAQMLDPFSTARAYTTADPIDPNRLTLATSDGRYAIETVRGCDWLSADENVQTWPNYLMPPYLALGDDAPGCVVHVFGRMDETPCFTGDDGACDVAAELSR